ncbi:hypothetical protein [Frigidibacter sp.]|uniref:hypothetical protein n=1 Tax=Frigidibacter sp. TaxID=2586418 RepID=UPI002732FDA7|nr:hypothetical protein [Frigidibacter sp.]MDP3342583.1 hypothetical protein [Frigidibacter sp.]
MVGASKILTVSYGTFSCTLEGFDDPFSTMKAIAEYFRELAAEDRYFGAEPPTPDAEMLHRIAEREIQRRVEAKIEANGVVLRQEDSAAPEAPPRVTMGQPAAPAPVVAEVAPVETSVLHVAAQAPATQPIAEDIEDDTPTLRPTAEAGSAEAESVAAKLMRIRAAVAGSRAAAGEAVEVDAPAPEAMAAEAVVEPVAAEFDEETAAEADTLSPEIEAVAETATARAKAEVADEPAADIEDATAWAPQKAAEAEAAADETPALAAADEETALLDSLAAALAQEEPVAVADEFVTEAVVAEELTSEEPVAEEPVAEDWPAAEFVAVETAEAQDAEIVALTDLVRDLEMEEAAPVLAEPAESTELGFVAAGVWPDTTVEDDAAEDSAEQEAAAQDDALDLSGWDEGEDISESRAEQVALTDIAPEALPDAIADMLAAETRLDGEDEDLVAAEAYELAEETAVEADDNTGFFETEAEVQPELEADPEPEAEAQPEPEAEAAPEPQPEPQPELRAENALQRARARVIKVRRIEVAEAQVAPQPAPQPAPESDADPVLSGIGAALGDTGLSAEDEADLMAELAAVEREAPGLRAAIDAPAAPPAPQMQRQQPEAPRKPEIEIEDAEIVGSDTGTDRPVLGRGPADEAAVSRLIETANTRLEGSETRRRFSAIAHLKAAVAATVADRALQTQAAGTALVQDSEEAIDRYRDDLTKAVRPRRPGDASAQTARPGADRQQAPLVLVSEQRVDRPAATQAQEVGAIRPRRVTTSTLRLTEMLDTEDEAEDDVPAPTPEEARSFADFADRLGANGLADLLEAAAAYTAAVEGRPHFSRPQIIKKVARLAEEADYSREASLRSFGMLLREGKIQKVKRGQFAISDTSRFMSEARRAAR